MSTVEEKYLERIKDFKPVSPKEADELLDANEENIVYIGRETCPYCRKFAGKLAKVASKEELVINYVHSEDPDHSDDIKAFREKYEIDTVPGFLYSDETGVKVETDSAMSRADIKAFIGLENE